MFAFSSNSISCLTNSLINFCTNLSFLKKSSGRTLALTNILNK
ncbi:hypothetical protein QCK_4056 [Clostridioides difficile CD45]|nr:hypothetical protein QCK_4056 [Clostridioides difficile CD45]